MKTTDYIIDKVDRLPKGYVFTYEEFVTKVNKKEAVIKCLNRLANSDKITKLSKGKFFKPEETVFGTLEPKQYQVVKDLLEKEGKTIGYLTGLSIYNDLGLTTQVSNVIQIGKFQIRPSFQRGEFKIKFIQQKNTITKENIPLFQILDSIRYLKKIPDSNVNQLCERFKSIIKSLDDITQKTLVRLALKYPPSTRAILGAILDEIESKVETDHLLDSLNSITSYKIGVSNEMFSTLDKWNIK